MKSRLKRFVRRFVAVPAKWIKSGRQEVLNLCTNRRIYLLLQLEVSLGDRAHAEKLRSLRN